MPGTFFTRRNCQSRSFLILLACLGIVCGAEEGAAAALPAITSIFQQGDSLVISATVPAGYKHAVLEAGNAVQQPLAEALVSGGINGNAAFVTFRVPSPSSTKFLRVRVGMEDTAPLAIHTGSPYFAVEYSTGPAPLTIHEKVGHVLSRLGYGPETDDLETVYAMGLAPYIEQQLSPESIDDSANTALTTRESELFVIHRPGEDSTLIKVGDSWRYFKGTQAPPAAWKDVAFNDTTWLQGTTGIGYGDDDDATVLDDMRQAGANPGYLAVYLRKTFGLVSPDDVDSLILTVDFDDGFVAYLNGTEIARANVAGKQPLHTEPASSDHEAGTPVDFDLSVNKSLLRAGDNVLAIELHNTSLTSSDASMIPALVSRKFLPVPPEKRIKDIASLQELAHVRGIYAKRQLQTVLAEFWENHFTTDYDKVMEYFKNLKNSDAQPAMSEQQAAAEAAQVEFLEYQSDLSKTFGLALEEWEVEFRQGELE